MEIKNDKKVEFMKLMVTGNHTRKELARRFGIGEHLAGRWAKESPYVDIELAIKELTSELCRLSKERNYQKNKKEISRLIVDIEKLKKIENA